MGFRIPLTSASAVDTGAGNRRVVITKNNSPQGGGLVLLYTSSGQPASLGAGSDDAGIGAVLASPAGPGGIASSLTVRGVGAGGEGIRLDTPGTVTTSGRIALDSAIRDVSGLGFGAGWTQWNAAGYRNLTFSLRPDGTVHVEGLVRWTPTAPGATKLITTVNGVFLPYIDPATNAHVVFPGCVANDDGRAYSVELLGAGQLQVRGTLPAAGFLSISGDYRAATW